MAYVGLADGAKSNWVYLETRTGVHIMDFYHASKYLGEASVAMRKDDAQRHKWHEEACHTLKTRLRGPTKSCKSSKCKAGNTDKGLCPEP